MKKKVKKMEIFIFFNAYSKGNKRINYGISLNLYMDYGIRYFIDMSIKVMFCSPLNLPFTN